MSDAHVPPNPTPSPPAPVPGSAGSTEPSHVAPDPIAPPPVQLGGLAPQSSSATAPRYPGPAASAPAGVVLPRRPAPAQLGHPGALVPLRTFLASLAPLPFAAPAPASFQHIGEGLHGASAPSVAPPALGRQAPGPLPSTPAVPAEPPGSTRAAELETTGGSPWGVRGATPSVAPPPDNASAAAAATDVSTSSPWLHAPAFSPVTMPSPVASLAPAPPPATQAPPVVVESSGGSRTLMTVVLALAALGLVGAIGYFGFRRGDSSQGPADIKAGNARRDDAAEGPAPTATATVSASAEAPKPPPRPLVAPKPVAPKKTDIYDGL